ncbi:PolC-type DNA polymerase III [Aquimarina hainanensis]|uniref:PolC-type DNA polymerase III n=1 Tax=Aquimarina hainanensis TaxID=1578017 RepID=A0ABW5N7Y3_9FLAO|nr:3'-5' exonuclease [Aquimarina sp. TRL1]QKX05010.1 3'-5' exonuclease [Aquimarina sp. TRL1]
MRLWQQKNKKEVPVFWKDYARLFDKKRKYQQVEEERIIAFDTETTGFNYKEDRILSIGAVAVKGKAINVSDQLELYLEQEVFKSETVAIHEIRKNHKYDKVSEKKALELFLDYVQDAVLIAHHAEFDKKMINAALKRHELGKLKNKLLDTSVLFRKTKHKIYTMHDPEKHYSLDELCMDLKISKSDRHTASGDAFITAIAFLKILGKLKKNGKVSMKGLFRIK